MPILFRWIFHTCLMRAASTLAVMLAIYFIIEAFDKARYLGKGLNTGLLIEYLALKAPFLISEFMPIVVLVATSIFLVELSTHRELAAIRAAGLGINKIVIPVLAVAMLAAATTFAIGEWVTPVTNQRLDVIERVHIQHQPQDEQGIQWLRDGQRFFRLTPLSDNRFALIVLETDAAGAWTQRLDAAWATYADGLWEMHDVYVSAPDKEGMSVDQKPVMDMAAAVGPKTAELPNPSHMQLLELNRYVNDLKKAGLNATTYAFTLQRKLAAPLACLFMAILAAGLCLHASTRSGAASWGLAAAISTGLLYYLFGNASGLLAGGSQLPAAYAAWLPNLVFGGAGIFLLLHREGH
ncbi:MAG TPA: LptF/LptG family permease [Mariprofundaceae bacterium]|nr:LptF/LptG family permease [Mariprofundaceae bacterium]